MKWLPKKDRRPDCKHHPLGTGSHPLGFHDIYSAIRDQNDFNEPQLYFLYRLVARKLNAFDPMCDMNEWDMKPYRKEPY